MTKFISPEEISSFCGACKSLEIKVSMRSQRSYQYCNNYKEPVFKVLELCRASGLLPRTKSHVQTKIIKEAPA